MILGEPPATGFDLRFRLFGFDVRITPWFWLLALLLGARGEAEPVRVLIWVGVVFVSILVHELGHAFAFRYFGINSHVVLYQFGGLAVPNSTFSGYGTGGNLKPRDQIIVSLAGPCAGFALAALTAGVVHASGEYFYFEYRKGMFPTLIMSDGIFFHPTLNPLVSDLIFVNIMWGLLNLLPLYPLDGGQVSRELFLLADYRDGLRKSLILSVATGAGIAVLGVLNQHIFLALMFGMLAYSSYRMLQGGGYGGGGGFGGGFGRRNPW